MAKRVPGVLPARQTLIRHFNRLRSVSYFGHEERELREERQKLVAKILAKEPRLKQIDRKLKRMRKAAQQRYVERYDLRREWRKRLDLDTITPAFVREFRAYLEAESK